MPEVVVAGLSRRDGQGSVNKQNKNQERVEQ
jgi:hypothetical protein